MSYMVIIKCWAVVSFKLGPYLPGVVCHIVIIRCMESGVKQLIIYYLSNTQMYMYVRAHTHTHTLTHEGVD